MSCTNKKEDRREWSGNEVLDAAALDRKIGGKTSLWLMSQWLKNKLSIWSIYLSLKI